MNNDKLPNKEIFMPTWLSLPSTWDESVSQVEMLQGILYNVNCIIQFLEDLQVNYESYTDNSINNLRNELTIKYDAIIEDLKNYHDLSVKNLYQYIDSNDVKYWIDTLEQVSRLDKRIDDLIVYVNSNLNEIREQHLSDVTNIYKYIENVRQELMVFIELNNQSLREWVENSYKEILEKVDEINEDGFRIFNPTTGEKDRIEKTVNDIYNMLRVFGITCFEFDNWFIKLNNTGNDFKRLNISAIEFDTKSWIILYGFKLDTIISPVSGIETSIQNAVEEVSTNSVCNTPNTGNLTCFQWDNLEFDQNDYEVNYSHSAYQHDFNAIHLFDNEQIKTLYDIKTPDNINGYVREYTIGVNNNNNTFIIIFDELMHRAQIEHIDIISLLPLSNISYYVDKIVYNMVENNVNNISLTIVTQPEEIEIQEIYVKLILNDQPLIPINISNTNPPKPIPLGVVTANQYDGYFNMHNGQDFKFLDMSAYVYDTNSIKFLIESEVS